ncbi:hypothetical protein MTP10_40805 [Nonomuraea sp. 3-1Str]|uniref:hypothetical protein n=1 Tax=Nonomuraea sp. 3-1Str TaxID=2929801 RepID=UPI00285E4CE2|nr:hypothetical protein [Nonomuraea sp. 3-1Str]MDR8415058.1 hypothetical protein [Nonomuraea sp. 3-1Str]
MITAMPVSPDLTLYPALAELAVDRPLADVEVTITLSKPSFHGQTEFRLRPGVIDADAVELFGFAQCHRLAAAIHERTRWSFALVEQYIDEAWKWAHCGVLTPTGKMLDIHGLREVAEVEREMSELYGPVARVRVVSTPADLRDVIAPGTPIGAWTDDITGQAGVEVIALLADTLIATASAESQSRPVTTIGSAKDAARHEARALLAYAADEHHFYSPVYTDGSRSQRLTEASAPTATYAAQAATAHALLAITGELAELRQSVGQMAAVRQDLADIAAAVRELATAVTAASTDVVDQVADLSTTLDQVAGKGLADVATEVAGLAAAVDDHGQRRRSWRDLFRRQHPADLPADPTALSARPTDIVMAAGHASPNPLTQHEGGRA